MSDNTKMIRVQGLDFKVETEPFLRRELATRISGTEFIVLPGVGHLSPLEAPSELAAAITTAISKIR